MAAENLFARAIASIPQFNLRDRSVPPPVVRIKSFAPFPFPLPALMVKQAGVIGHKLLQPQFDQFGIGEVASDNAIWMLIGQTFPMQFRLYSGKMMNEIIDFGGPKTAIKLASFLLAGFGYSAGYFPCQDSSGKKPACGDVGLLTEILIEDLAILAIRPVSQSDALPFNGFDPHLQEPVAL